MNPLRTAAAATVAVSLLGGTTFFLVSRRANAGSAESAGSAAPAVVQYVNATRRSMRRTVRLSGTLKSGSRATLSAKAGGRVTGVLVRQGDRVRAGQTLVTVDASDTRAQIAQAQAGVTSARAFLDKAIEGQRLRKVEIERRIDEAKRGLEHARLELAKAEAGIQLQHRTGETDVQRAQAGVDAAKSALAQAKRGARPEQRRQAEIQVRQAERGVETAKRGLDDVQFLFTKGGANRVQLDEAKEGYHKAVDGLALAKNQLDLVNSGATPDEIASAEAQVRSAEAGLSAARVAANRQDVEKIDLEGARMGVRQAQDALKSAEAGRAELRVAAADVRAARGSYEQAVAASRLAEQQLTSASIVSPVDGIVTELTTNVGELAGPGQPAVTVVGTTGVFLEANAPARVIQDLRPGQPVVASLDSLRGQKYSGVIRSVGRIAGSDGRSFPVEISISAPAGVLKPGSFARAEVALESHPDATAIPVEALRSEGDRTSVWVVRNGRLVEAPVRVPVQDDRYAMVEGDVRVGDQVVVSSAPGVRAGDAVEARKASGR